jgi:hypothetical protein
MLAAGWMWTSVRQGTADRASPPWVNSMARDQPSARRDGRAGAVAVRRRDRPRPAQFERYIDSADPWLRAVGQAYLSTYGFSLARWTARRALPRARGLRARRAVGRRAALTQLAEFTELRAEHAASVQTLTEAAAISRLGVRTT